MGNESRGMKSIPRSDRPRERMFDKGVAALADRELIAVLLGSGGRGRSALDVAAELLARFDNVRALADGGLPKLVGVPGVGAGKAARIVAAAEFGRRVVRYRGDEPYPISTPNDAAQLLMDDMRTLDREEFRVLLLDAKNRVIGVEIVSVGTLTASLIHPREGLKAAIVRSAAAVILVHNHPTGVPTPSREDIEITERFVEAGRVVGIEVLDHVIIGDGRFESLREMGYL